LVVEVVEMTDTWMPRSYETVTPLDREYLLQKLIPYGTVTGLFGSEGIGKGFLEALLAAIVSSGSSFADGTQADQGSVIMITPEDDSNVTVVKRLIASGADRKFVLDMTRVQGVPFSIPDSIPELQRVITELGNVRLVIMDPLGDLSSIGLTSSVTKMRQTITTPLLDLCEATGVALVLTMHTTKDGKTLQGSGALRQALRQVLTVTRLKTDRSIREIRLDKSDDTDDAKAPVLRYTIKGDGRGSHAEWLSADSATAEDVVWHDYTDEELSSGIDGWSREAGQTVIVNLLRRSAPETMRAGDIASRVGLTYIATRVLLAKLALHGDVYSERGNWSAVG
jgi:hypothetical protein